MPPCREEVYSTTTSSLAFESNNRTDSFYVQDQVVININYDTMSESIVSESIAMTPTQVYGSVGGLLGLYLGISFLSIIEIVGELFILRLLPRFCGYRRLYGVRSKKQ
jgi:hypothetical protein